MKKMQYKKNNFHLLDYFHQNANKIIFDILSLFAHWMQLPFELVNTDCKVKWVILKTIIETKYYCFKSAE